MNSPHAEHAQRKSKSERVLVVDDDAGITQCVTLLMKRAGYQCTACNTGGEALAKLESEEFELVITDLRLPDATGIEITSAAKAINAETPVILMTSFSSVESAIEALRKGANDYIIKPFDNDAFLFSVERALNERRTRHENAVLKRNLKKVFTQNTIIGESEGIKRLLAMVARVADTDANVLIQGESGTGKELVAQAIHFGGNRAQKPFVPVNCGAIPSELVEAELFGHAKGAYTGAVASTEGLIREASGGTLFLDEISELPLNVQVKLLRVIQERQVRPLGSSQSYEVDTRFLAASNRNLKEAAANGTFRADLYYRLNVITIVVPPLRERGKDIEILANHFMRQYSRKFGKQIVGMDPEFINFLNHYSWPGNVRELQNVIERAVIMSDGHTLRSVDMDEPTSIEDAPPAVQRGDETPLPIEDYIKQVVIQYQDQHGEAELAAMLGIGRKALWVRRKSWGLYRNNDRPGRSATYDTSKSKPS
jgi:DNA-binding NtrC family response regulator